MTQQQLKNELNRGWRQVETVTIPGATPPVEVEVLVVGAGPSGLATAAELHRHGVDVAVVDTVRSASLQRAGAMGWGPRVVELFSQWGIAEEVQRGWTFPPEWNHGTRLRTSLVGHSLDRGPSRSFSKRPGGNYSFSDGIRRPQTVVQQALLARLGDVGVVVAGGWKVVGLHEAHDHAVVEVEHVDHGTRREIKARFVVGADGGSSTVRRLAGIERDGEYTDQRNFRFVVRVRDLPSTVGLSLSATNVIVNQDYSGFLAAISETDWRLYAGPYPVGYEPTEDELLALTRAAFGVEVDAEIVSVTSFYKVTRIASTFRRKHVFLVGDAAHVRTPGGNLAEGFGDVANLGWKLAAVLNGRGGEALLDSYDAERRRHNWRVGEVAFHRSQEADRSVEQARAIGFPSDEDVTDDANNRRRRITQLLNSGSSPQPGITFDERYDSSPVIWYDNRQLENETPWAAELYVPGGSPGHRAPNGNVDPFGGTLYDRLRSHIALVVLGEDVSGLSAFEHAAEERGIDIEIVLLPDAEARELYGASYVLVRPDHHVAWRGNGAPVDAGAVLDHIYGRESSVSLHAEDRSVDEQLVGAAGALASVDIA